MAQRYFATIQPGLEEALLEEVRAIGGKRASVLHGGVEFDATNGVFYKAALSLRCTNRLWLRVDEFRARDAPELYNKTVRIDWARLIDARLPVEVKAASHSSHLFHTGKIADTVLAGIHESIGRTQRPNTKSRTPVTVLARLADDRCELSLDASGELHYRRGWKTSAVAAPMRESVASSILRLSGWSPGDRLIDPFCGSGTILIEAAQRTARIPAGKERDFAFQQWANYRPELWRKVMAEAAKEQCEAPEAAPTCFGFDLNSDAVEAARHNAGLAGVSAWCEFEEQDVETWTPPGGDPGFIVTNPPWGVRLDDETLSALDQFVDAVTSRFDGWRAAWVAPEAWFTPRARVETKFELGGVPVRLWTTR